LSRSCVIFFVRGGYCGTVRLPLIWLFLPYRFNLNDDVLDHIDLCQMHRRGKRVCIQLCAVDVGHHDPLLAVIVGALGWLAHPFPVLYLAVGFTIFCWIAVVWTVQLFSPDAGLARWQACILGAMLVTHGQIYLGGEVMLFQFVLVIAIILFLRGARPLRGIVYRAAVHCPG